MYRPPPHVQPMDLLARVRHTIRRHRLAHPGTKVVAALSGGSDSVALTHLLATLSRLGELSLVGAAHFNHRLRPTADADERLSAEIAAALAVPLLTDRGDVAALADTERRSLEDAARTLRHAFLEKARLQFGADVVAFGHTRDDQAETFLLRLLRGAGPAGLGGMHPRRGVIVRPLLDCRRAELVAYLESNAIPFVTDESNEDVSIPRNRVRKELLPLLETRFNPSIVDVLADEATLLRDVQSLLDSSAAEWSAEQLGSRLEESRLPVAPLLDAPPALARLAIHRAMTRVARGRTVPFRDAERALDLARACGSPFDAPGQRVQRIDDCIVLTGRAQARSGWPPPAGANLFQSSLSIPGEARLGGRGEVVAAEQAQWAADVTNRTGNEAAVQVASGSLPLSVRRWKPGDRFRPLGLGGWKKLQDFFVDEKVPRERRQAVPLVVDAADRIVWVAGHRIDHAFRVKDPAQAVIILRLKGGGGST